MYTVLILSRNAMDSYHEYEPIMSIYDKSDAIGVCTWYESANTIDTAVPELSSLIHRHKQWRAIVIQTELAEREDRYAIRDNNPFDYMDGENADGENKAKPYPFLDTEFVDGKSVEVIRPSKFPMVLISQLLGGIPASSPEFEKKLMQVTVDEHGKEAYTEVIERDADEEETDEEEAAGEEPADDEYEEETDDPEKEAKNPERRQITERLFITQKQNNDELREYKRLCDAWSQQYACAGSPPSEIILIRRRKISYIGVENRVQTDWGGFMEIQSSQFWHRMGYPNLCRFLTFDVDIRGQLTEQGDMFRFWNAVLLLSGNQINADILQPYRLYRVDVKMNQEKLQQSIQTAVNRLNYAQYRVDQVSAAQQQTDEEPSPGKDQEALTIDVPVELNLTDAISRGYIPAPRRFAPLPKSKAVDQADWEAYTAEAAKAWNDEQIAVKRVIGKTAKGMRKATDIDESDVRPLTEYEKEDLIDYLDEYYFTILKEQETLPVLRKKYISDVLGPADREVRQHIDRRFGAKRLILLFTVFLLSIGAAMGCAFYQLSSPWYIPLAYIFGTVLICLGSMRVCIRLKRRKLQKKAKAYYALYMQVQDELKASGENLASFLGHVGTSMRGKSYLFALDSLEKKQQEVIDATNRRTKTLSRFQDVLVKWCDALHLSVDFDDRNAMEEMIDSRYSIDFDLLSTLDVSRDHKVKINKTGTTVKGIYDFVEYLLIEREGIYDE